MSATAGARHEVSEDAGRGRRIGILEAVLAGVGFGFLGVFGKVAYAKGITGGENLACRFGVSALLLGGYLLATRPRSLRLPPRTIATCAGLGIFGYALFASFYFAALKGLSASLTVLLLYTYPVPVTLGAWWVLKERPGKRRLVALPLVMTGLVLIVVGEAVINDQLAIVWGLASAVLYAAYILVSSRTLAGTDALPAVAWIQLFAAVALGVVNFGYVGAGARLAFIVAEAWYLLLAIAVVCTAVPMVLFIRSLQKLTPPEASMLSTAEPITGVILATIFLGERPTWMQVAGGALVVGTLVWMTRQPRATQALGSRAL
jgi:drug/metabolite transporter (DMT)-like permease